MDLLQGVKEALNEAAVKDGNSEETEKMTLEKIFGALEKAGISDGDQAKLKEALLKKLKDGGDLFKGDFLKNNFIKPPIGSIPESPWMSFLLLFTMVTFVLMVLDYSSIHMTEDMVQSLEKEFTPWIHKVVFVYALVLFILSFLGLVFFGYKLYKSLVERERRKEEKRRQKQQKKKK